MNVKDKKVLIVATCGPEMPDRCAAPFFFAQKAADLGARVEICFVLQSALLLKQGVAEEVCAKEGGQSIRRFLDEALRAGVRFHPCDAALKLNDMTPEDLIEEVEDLVGPNYLITRGLEVDLVLSF
jgi:predicted peroxiredoxin